MMKKRLLITAIIFFVIAANYLYQNVDGSPGKLPSREHAVKVINEVLDQADVREVMEMIQLDSHHAFVPFVSMSGQLGMSYWVWEKFKWRVGRVDMNGSPHIWKLDKRDPSKHYFVWHYNPEGIISGLTYYLIRERNARSIGGNNFYTPRIQMESPFLNLEEKPYGALPFPEEWASIVREDMSVNGSGQRDVSLFGGSKVSMLHVGLLPQYNEKKAAEHFSSSSHSYTYSNKYLDLEFVWILNQSELELAE